MAPRAAAIGCRAHTGWAALVLVAAGPKRPEIFLRRRAELADPGGSIRRNVYQSARGMDPDEAAARVEAAERIASEQASASLDQVMHEAKDKGCDVRWCAVVVGSFGGAPLASILASHALAHAAEGKLYQQALLQGARAIGLKSVAVSKKAIWEEAESAFGLPEETLRNRIVGLRQEIGPPWAEDQRLAALAAWMALAT